MLLRRRQHAPNPAARRRTATAAVVAAARARARPAGRGPGAGVGSRPSTSARTSSSSTRASRSTQIQAKVDAIAAQQVPAQFGDGRYALLFKPGTYGTAEQPLRFQVGYFTEVAGLGQNPGDVVINGAIEVYNRASRRPRGAPTDCTALVNFWRSLSNLSIHYAAPATPTAAAAAPTSGPSRRPLRCAA